jgi:uncharacterized protein YodC (DUF2158 family)
MAGKAAGGLAVGDVVTLRSGSDPMTVANLAGEQYVNADGSQTVEKDHVRLVWFDADRELSAFTEVELPVAVLVKQGADPA